MRKKATWTTQFDLLSIDTEAGSLAGAAYVFRYSPTLGRWFQATELLASDGKMYDHLGWSASIWGNRVVAGIHDDDTGGNGLERIGSPCGQHPLNAASQRGIRLPQFDLPIKNLFAFIEPI